MKRPEVQQQYVFTDNGEIEPEAEEVETDLQDWGAVEPEVERETKIEVEQGSLMADTRSVVKESESEQETLMADVDDDQVTLSGESAEQSKW